MMSPVQARPQHLRFVLLMVMSLSPFALAGNEILLEFVRGLGAPYDPPSGPTVRDVLLDLCVYLTGRMPAENSRLQRCYRGRLFFHLVTDVWMEWHGTGSYGSLVLRCVDLLRLFHDRVPLRGGSIFGTARPLQHQGEDEAVFASLRCAGQRHLLFDVGIGVEHEEGAL